MSVRDRLYERKFAWHMKRISAYPRKRIARVVDGHVYRGTDTKHRLDAARRIRVLQSLKLNRS